MNIYRKWLRQRIIRLLTTSPERLMKIGDAKLIPAFRNAVKNVAAYKKILNEHNVDPRVITDKESYTRLLPIIDKSVFDKYDIIELCKGGDLSDMQLASTSGGTSGTTFSFGLTGSKELRDLSFFIDTLAEISFNVSQRKTLWISALAMGVHVRTNLPLAETSVRSDMVLALLKKIGPQFEQIILHGNPFFIKKLIEEGAETGIDWKSMLVHVVIGEDWTPENYNDYIASYLGIDCDRSSTGKIGIILGITELGITLFQETEESAWIRRLARKDKEFGKALFGKYSQICPILFTYHPYQIFLEEVNDELVFSSLSRDAMIPLLRYCSGDKGIVYTYDEVKALLERFGYGKYAPHVKLPMVAVSGRRIKAAGFIDTITPEHVKTGIYSDFEAAKATTGYFRMSLPKARLKIELQLCPKREPSESLKRRFYECISKYVKTDFELILYPYAQFPYGMGLIYEYKFKYI